MLQKALTSAQYIQLYKCVFLSVCIKIQKFTLTVTFVQVTQEHSSEGNINCSSYINEYIPISNNKIV